MKKGTCKHFSGLLKDKCQAGHNYEQVMMTPPFSRDGIVKRIPCFAENGVSTCPDFIEPTDEEITIYDEAVDAYTALFMQRLVVVRPAIVAHIEANGWKKKSVRSKIPCPICKDGTVAYSYAGNFNGHIHAQCTTGDCVGWIE